MRTCRLRMNINHESLLSMTRCRMSSLLRRNVVHLLNISLTDTTRFQTVCMNVLTKSGALGVTIASARRHRLQNREETRFVPGNGPLVLRN